MGKCWKSFDSWITHTFAKWKMFSCYSLFVWFNIWINIINHIAYSMHTGGEVGYITPAIYSYVVAYGVNQLYYLGDFRTVPEITWCWSMVLFVFYRASNKRQQWQICQRQQLGDNGISVRVRALWLCWPLTWQSRLNSILFQPTHKFIKVNWD